MRSYISTLTRGLTAVAVLICLTLGLATCPAHAQAGYYTYTFNDVNFTNVGSTGSVTGYFDYDPTTEEVGAYDITTSPGMNFRFRGNGFNNGYDYDTVMRQPAKVTLASCFRLVTNDDPTFEFQPEQALTGPGNFGIFNIFEGTKTDGTVESLRGGNKGTLTGSPEASAVPNSPRWPLSHS